MSKSYETFLWHMAHLRICTFITNSSRPIKNYGHFTLAMDGMIDPFLVPTLCSYSYQFFSYI